MVIPGFTADASLGPAQGRYRGTQEAIALATSFHPSQATTSCMSRCRRGCNPLRGRERIRCLMDCNEVCDQTSDQGPPPPPSPCRPGWRWVSGPSTCPTCCRGIGDFEQCEQPFCSP
jgi:hypothetical protein